MLSPEQAFERWAAGDAGVVDEIRAYLDRHVSEGRYLEWARVCRQVGLAQLSLRLFQRALKERPTDPDVLLELGQLYEEQGQTQRALRLLDRARQVRPSDVRIVMAFVRLCRSVGRERDADRALEEARRAGVELPMSGGGAEPEGTLETATPSIRTGGVRLWEEADVMRFLDLFSGREDTYARQWSGRGKGGYSPVREPLSPRVIRNHLLGNETVGIYLLRLDNTVRLFVLDIDVRKNVLEAALTDRDLATRLRTVMHRDALRLCALFERLGLPVLHESSGYKGRHLWVFLEEPIPAERVHAFGRQFLQWADRERPTELSYEFFPKQSRRAGKGLGNLVKLPLGIHRRSGRASRLFDHEGEIVEDPRPLLRSIVRVDPARFDEASRRLRGIVGSLPPRPPRSRGSGRAESEPASEERGVEAVEASEEPVRSESVARRESGPPPPDRQPVWTEADFLLRDEVRRVFAGCAVLRELRERAVQRRELSYDEQIVLRHTLGHLDAGVLAVNYLFDLCENVSPTMYLKTRLACGSKSCASIRRSVRDIACKVACRCDLKGQGRYETPLLFAEMADAQIRACSADPDASMLRVEGQEHTVTQERATGTDGVAVGGEERSRGGGSLERSGGPRIIALPLGHGGTEGDGKGGLEAGASGSGGVVVGSPEYDAARYAVLDKRLTVLREEWAWARDRLLARLRGMPDRRIPFRGGAYLLIDRDGIEELVWRPDGSERGAGETVGGACAGEGEVGEAAAAGVERGGELGAEGEVEEEGREESGQDDGRGDASGVSVQGTTDGDASQEGAPSPASPEAGEDEDG